MHHNQEEGAERKQGAFSSNFRHESFPRRQRQVRSTRYTRMDVVRYIHEDEEGQSCARWSSLTSFLAHTVYLAFSMRHPFQDKEKEKKTERERERERTVSTVSQHAGEGRGWRSERGSIVTIEARRRNRRSRRTRSPPLCLRTDSGPSPPPLPPF